MLTYQTLNSQKPAKDQETFANTYLWKLPIQTYNQLSMYNKTIINFYFLKNEIEVP